MDLFGLDMASTGGRRITRGEGLPRRLVDFVLWGIGFAHWDRTTHARGVGLLGNMLAPPRLYAPHGGPHTQ